VFSAISLLYLPSFSLILLVGLLLVIQHPRSLKPKPLSSIFTVPTIITPTSQITHASLFMRPTHRINMVVAVRYQLIQSTNTFAKRPLILLQTSFNSISPLALVLSTSSSNQLSRLPIPPFSPYLPLFNPSSNKLSQPTSQFMLFF